PLRIPDFFSNLLSYLGWLPGAPLTHDQWLMLQRDNVPTAGEPGLEAFGIQPTPLASVAYEWLGRFHKGGKFSGRRSRLMSAH
ncbi:MAG TPA: complex I NDUFA9 subunit family protein, partial [Sphingomicrobium sp.]|nr:complex I NDUFA9 subunit family protein [Sphingomicrobium sp.]